MRSTSPVLATSLLLALAASPLAAVAQTTAVPPEPPSIITTGIGEARAIPDRAVVSLGVQFRAPSAAQASAANAATQRAVIDTLVAMGVPRSQIATVGYNVHPETRHDPATRRERLTAYVVTNMVRVELRRTELVGPAIDAALAKGANQVHALTFYAQNTDEPRRQALTQATERARAAPKRSPRPPAARWARCSS